MAATEAVVPEQMPPEVQPAPKRQHEVADVTILNKSLALINTLPTWLHPVVKTYFKRRWGGMQPHTAKESAPTLAYHLVRLWKWFVERHQLLSWDTLTRADLEDWLSTRQQQGLKPSTIRRELSLLKACIREAIVQEVGVSSDLLRVNPPAAPHPLPRYLKAEAMTRLEQTVFAATDDETLSSKLQRAWFLTLSLTGVRCAELLNIRLSDIDFSRQRLVIYDGKLRHDRVVYLSPVLSAALAAYLAVRPETGDDHFWIKPCGGQLARHNVKYRLHTWAKSCQVEVTPHRLRHTFATRLVNAGLPLASVAKLLGHRSLDMTQHYARLYEQTIKDQFVEAMAHIEGIAAFNWPRSEQTTAQLPEHICDSV